MAMSSPSHDAPDASETWTCPICGEVLEHQFETCWKCAAAAEPPAGISPEQRSLLGYLLFTFRLLSLGAFCAVIFFGCVAFVRNRDLYAAASLFLFGVFISLLFAILMRFDEQQPETWLLGALSWTLGVLLSPGPLAFLCFVSAGLLA
ncbi:MAG: hypothetical protein NTW87_28880, partial [Planctomycetota bacterium]|nr:hypothetical protein [Planctomycetota bacterium]